MTKHYSRGILYSP